MTQLMDNQLMDNQLMNNQLMDRAADRERLDRNERRNSLAAFLRAIKFKAPPRRDTRVERDFAQIHSRASRRGAPPEDKHWVRSAN